MKRADQIVALVLAVFSIYLMWKSTELPIGWRPGMGPGGGAFPFWLSAGMLICSGAVLVRGLLGRTPESHSTEPFIHPEARTQILTVVASLAVTVAAIHVVGVYVALPLFAVFYLRYLGRHSWVLTLAFFVTLPVVIFLFFERMLLIILPKGITDEFFYIFF